jgi:glycosyltransferase involved in cell wall biosynthesis
MRILFCNFEYPPLGGGGGVINALLAEELAGRHDVSVLTSRAHGHSPREIVNGVEVIRVPVLNRDDAAAASMISMACYLPSGCYRGRELVKDRRFDVINTHFVVPTGPVGHYLSRAAGIPNVLTAHGGDLFDPSKWYSPHRHALLRTSIRRLLNAADSVVAQSANTIANVHRYYLPELRCELIPLGIRRPKTSPATRAEYGLNEADKVLVTIGRLVERKANDQLIRLLAELKDERTVLVIIGEGPCRTALEQLARDLGVDTRVHFAGFVDEARKLGFLQLADLYVSASQHEGFGLVFLEAMAAGLPVVCYDFGGQTDFLADGETGALVPLNDLDRLRTSCRRLLADPALRQVAAEENLRRVEEYFIDTCALKYEQLFERTANQYRR